MMWSVTGAFATRLGKWISGAARESRSHKPTETALVRNLNALHEATMKPDPRRVAFLGQPGSGKSTLIKKLSEGRACPMPVIGTQTDATDWSKLPDADLLCHWGKCSASDVPGYDTTNHPLSTYLAYFPFGHFGKICLVLSGKVHAADQEVYRAIRDSGTPVIVVRSFADSLHDDDRCAVRQDLQSHFSGLDVSSIVFVSNRSDEGIERLRLMI